MWAKARFLLPLLLVLGVLAWGASSVMDSVTRRWFEKDVGLRSRLVLRSARETIGRRLLSGDRGHLGRTLLSITRDERIMAALVCDASLERFASTPGFPSSFGCRAIGRRMRTQGRDGDAQPRWRSWAEATRTRGGPVHVTAEPVRYDGKTLGFVVMIHDMSYADRRARITSAIGWAALLLLAMAASLVTLLAERLSWRSWTAEVRRSLAGGGERREFSPLLQDIRDLVAQLSAESADAPRPGGWDPERLRQTLHRHLRGERVVIVANREPYVHDRLADGPVRVLHPASGLVTALEPVLRACSGVWVAHGSGSADRETADERGRLSVPPGEGSYLLRRVWLTPEQEKGYYYGFANEGLWPLCHIADARPTFRAEDWAHYQDVNRLFADAVCEEVGVDDPIVFVQDYHFALLPRLLRKRLPKATILSFWHIPWPNSERFGICPYRGELLRGLLGSSIVGFHTQLHCNNFLEAVDRYLEARIDREQQGVVQKGRLTLVRPHPISVQWPCEWAAAAPPVAECRAGVIAELGLRPDATIGIGVDRLDYTKGVEERFLAVEKLLERYPEHRGRFTFVQLAAPSRTAIERYQMLDRNVAQLAERINERFGTGSYRPIVLQLSHHEPPTVFRYYRAGDVCYVSSLHDGMNLVAKEFVAARDDERGVLVLSCFTGAARELTEALIVNPYDIEQAADALAVALTMPVEEQRARMHAMRLLISELNVYRWAGRILADAAKLRERERLSGRLADGFNLVAGRTS